MRGHLLIWIRRGARVTQWGHILVWIRRGASVTQWGHLLVWIRRGASMTQWGHLLVWIRRGARVTQRGHLLVWIRRGASVTPWDGKTGISDTEEGMVGKHLFNCVPSLIPPLPASVCACLIITTTCGIKYVQPKLVAMNTPASVDGGDHAPPLWLLMLLLGVHHSRCWHGWYLSMYGKCLFRGTHSDSNQLPCVAPTHKVYRGVQDWHT